MKKVITVIVVILVLNALCFGYYNPLHGSDLNSYRLEPNTVGFNAVEGLGIMYADKNGFSNRDLPLVDNGYILVMGSSYSKGDQVAVDKRYSDLLNTYLGYSEELGVYNLAYNGGKFDDIVKNFKELVEEFPNSKTVIVEVTDSQLQLSKAECEEALNQVQMKDSITGETLSRHDLMGTVKVRIKQYCPLLLLYVNQYIQWKNAYTTTKDGYNTDQQNSELEEYRKRWYKNALSLIRGEYEGEMVVVYHNGFSLNENGKMRTEDSRVKADFFKACAENDITMIDMTEIMNEHFQQSREIPYGFWNTAMGTGHLNEAGHRLIAQTLYTYLKEK